MIEIRRNTATRQQLADDYGVSTRTINKWIDKAGISIGKRELLWPNKLQEFYNKIGVPFIENIDAK